MSTQETTTATPSGIRRLTRRRGGKLIAGVCTGLGDYTGLDPILFRIAFVALALMGGSGFLLYGIAWLFIPEAGSDTTHAHDIFGRFETAPWLGVALLIGGGALLLSQLGLWRPPVVWGSALLVLGFILFREHGPDSTRSSASAVDPRATAGPASSSDQMAVTTATDTEVTATSVLPSSRAARVRPRRERSALGWFTIAAALVALGIAALLDSVDAIHLTIAQYFALPLLAIGGGLIVGAWRGRSRFLIFLGILLIPFLLAASLIHVPVTGAAGQFVYRPQSSADLRGPYHLTAGQMTLDLRKLALSPGTTDVTATIGAGEIRVLVPRRTSLDIDGQAGLGAVTVFGSEHSGTGVNVQRSTDSPSSASVLALHLHVAFGDVKVERRTPTSF
jgi:phage shock protein PspC (stress-responsive transcriptional regulator)